MSGDSSLLSGLGITSLWTACRATVGVTAGKWAEFLACKSSGDGSKAENTPMENLRKKGGGFVCARGLGFGTTVSWGFALQEGSKNGTVWVAVVWGSSVKWLMLKGDIWCTGGRTGSVNMPSLCDGWLEGSFEGKPLFLLQNDALREIVWGAALGSTNEISVSLNNHLWRQCREKSLHQTTNLDVSRWLNDSGGRHLDSFQRHSVSTIESFAISEL